MEKEKLMKSIAIIVALTLLCSCGDNTQRSNSSTEDNEVKIVDEVVIDGQENATDEEVVETEDKEENLLEEDNESTDSEEVLMMDDDLDEGGVL